MPKVKHYSDTWPYQTDEDSGIDWEIECVKYTGQGCVCWRCEEDHDDTTQWVDDWEGREYFDKEMNNGNQ